MKQNKLIDITLSVDANKTTIRFIYGDKSPRSYLARIFAISWILLGITIFSMFTASLTTILQSASLEVPPIIYGKKVSLV